MTDPKSSIPRLRARSASVPSDRPAMGAALVSMLVAVGLSGFAYAAPDSGDDVHPMDWPAMQRAIQPDANCEAFVERLIDAMTIEEKIGQMIQADIDSVTPADVANYHLGSVLAGGNAAPGGNVRASAASWLNLTDQFFNASVDGPVSHHVRIPILFGIDAVHGHARIPGATVFPQNVGLGAAHDPALIEQVGRATAEEVAVTGIDWTFAPTVAVVRDVRWGRSYESYSEDPGLVADYARSMVAGLQGRIGTADFLSAGHTLASVKHFLGDGGTVAGRDQFDSLVDERTLREVHGAGYPAAISAGALIVMASYNGWHGIKMHANRPLLTEVLKDRWDFPGFVVGDWNAQEEIPGCTKFSCAEFFNAGVDMYMAPDSWKALYGNLATQVRTGQITYQRVDDAVRRILRVKVLAGLFQKKAPRKRFAVGALASVGSAAHRAVARQAVRESLVLLKNNAMTLPLDPHSHILVTGPGADDIGMQSGGWTIDWQGDHNTNADFPGATSILGGIRAAVAAAGGTVVTSTDSIDAEKPAAAIVVYGETPYAEFEGDRETLEFSAAGQADLKTLKRLRAAHIPVVSVFISGRPLWVNRELNASDAFVAAWLPGSEGAGVADLIFRTKTGETQRDFTGRLSFSWPATAMPVTFDKSGTVRGALFQRGFGLKLGQHDDLGPVSENPRIPPSIRERDTLFHAGHVTAPWSIFVSDASADVRLTMQSQVSPQSAVTTRLTARGVEVSWSGTTVGEFRIGGHASDYKTLAHDNHAILLRYRVEEAPRHPVGFGMRCEAPYGTPFAPETAAADWKRCGVSASGSLDLTAQFRAAPADSWQTLAIPLDCIERMGGKLGNVDAPFALETSGRFAVTFEEIKLVREVTPSVCPPKVL
jgi:beta-glucosidase